MSPNYNIASPSRRKRFEALKELPWTVDNTDSRVIHFGLTSTPKSILKGSRTPQRYEHNQTQQERATREYRNRRVSFAAASSLRLFNQEDTIEFSYNSEDDLFAQPEPIRDMLDSPVRFDRGSSLSILSGSPSDRRRRRRDIFGTPPDQRSTYALYKDDVDDEDSDLDISQFLTKPKNSRNPFTEDDDSEENKEQDLEVNTELNPFAEEDTTTESEIFADYSSTDDYKDTAVRTEKESAEENTEAYIHQDSDKPSIQQKQSEAEVKYQEEEEEEEEDVAMVIDSDEEYTNDYPPQPTNSYVASENQSAGYESDSRMDITQELKGGDLDMQITQEHKDNEYEMQITQEYKDDDFEMQLTQEIATQTPRINYASSPDITTSITMLPWSEHRLLQNESPHPELFAPIVDDFEQISVKDFFQIVGITFTQETPLNNARIQDIEATSERIEVDRQAAAAAFILPQLELYQNMMEDMEADIEISKEKTEEIEERVNKCNPPFFSDHSNADDNTQREMEFEYRRIKQLSEKKSLEKWYEWWGNALDIHIKKLEGNRDRLLEDKKLLESLDLQLRHNLPHLLDHQNQVAASFGKAREKEMKYQSFDHIKLSKLQNEIEHQRRSIESFHKELKDLEMKENELLEKIKTLDSRKTQLKHQTVQTKQTIKDNKKVTESDLVDIQKNYYNACTIRGWRLLKVDKNRIEIMFGDDLKVKLDSEGLQSKQPEDLSFQISTKKEKELGSLIALAKGLNAILEHEMDIARRTVVYWNKLKLINDVLNNAKLYYRVYIESFEAVEVKDIGVKIYISALDRESKSMVNIYFNIKVENMLKFPYMDLSSIDIQVEYNDSLAVSAKQAFEELMKKNGLLDIVDSIASLFE
ncbi:Spc7 kinetochore protein-domain-containing protein [Sporodiniella umbellata]|nr:Spc7 kinetochore protein-domain-containing protein [Sporodiniella umbellata]